MIINEIGPGREFMPLVQQQNQLKAGEAAPSGTFSDTVKEFLTDVNNLQKESSDMTERFIKGEPVDLHDVMIAQEKADTSFQLLLELRNKFLDLYQTVNRMQV